MAIMAQTLYSILYTYLYKSCEAARSKDYQMYYFTNQGHNVSLLYKCTGTVYFTGVKNNSYNLS